MRVCAVAARVNKIGFGGEYGDVCCVERCGGKTGGTKRAMAGGGRRGQGFIEEKEEVNKKTLDETKGKSGM